VKRLPNDKVSIEVTEGKPIYNDPLDKQIAMTLNEALAGTCEIKSLFGSSLLSVTDINGKAKASDFLK